MELSTQKSDWLNFDRRLLVKSPKEAMRKTLRNTLERQGLVVNLFPTSFVTRLKDATINMWR